MIVQLTTILAVTLSLQLRERDVAEILSTEKGSDIAAWAARQVSPRGDSFALVDPAGYPVAMGGAFPMWPGVAQTWLAASPRLPAFTRELMRACRELHRGVAAQGAHRFQTYVGPGYATGRRFLEHLGYECEGTVRAITRDRQDLDLMAKIVPEQP